MRQKVIHLLLRTAFFCFLLSAFCSAFNSRKPFDVSADSVEYSDTTQTITATGHVVVSQESSTLKADSLIYDRAAKHLYAKGNVFLDDKGSILMGEVMEYDLVKEAGSVTSGMGYQAPWIFSGEKWQKHPDHVTGDGTSFTSCDLAEPHYHIRASRMHLFPDERFWAWHNIVFLDKIPIFYSPFVYKNLADRRIVVRFEPGHDTNNGNFLKTLTTVRLTDQVYNKIYYDHYSKRGNGVGNEFNYSVPGLLKGSLFGYYIDPRPIPELPDEPDTPQYNIRAYHWQQLVPTLTLQSNVNIRNNVSFNSEFFPQDTNAAVSDITSSLALTHQTGPINQRLVVERMDAPDPGDTNPFAATHVQTANYPRYDFTFFQKPLWTPGKKDLIPGTTAPLLIKPNTFGPLLFNANANFGNTYQRLDDQYHPNAAGSFTLSEAILLSRDWSFTPSLTPQLNWQDKFDPQPPPPAGSTTPVSNVGLFRGYQGRLGTSELLRWRPFSALTLDQTYSLTARMEPNKLGLDQERADDGLETHHLNWLAFWRPTRRTLLRSFSGYDLRQIDDEPLSTYQQRKWDPWTTELTYSATSRTSYFFRYALSYYPLKSQLWEALYNVKGPYRSYWNTGLLYNKGAPGKLTWNNRFGLYVSPGWRIDATLDSLVPNSSVKDVLKLGDLINEELSIVRDLHCWQARFNYRNTPPFAHTYMFMLDLKLGVEAEKRIANEDLESQYYPWRARGTSRY